MVVTKNTAEPAKLANVEVGEPGYGLGIAGFITAFFFSVVGLVLSAVALHQSKSIGKRNKLALAGMIIGIVRVVMDVVAVVGLTIGLIALAHYCTTNADQCSSNQNSDDGGYSQDNPTATPPRTY